jgi:prephenate dehydratase
MRRVAFQGERGAYSEEAVLRRFGGEAEVLPCRTLRDVFRATEDGTATEGLAPIENSLAGSINESYDLLLQRSLTITGETVLRVRHCLLARPGQTLAGLRQVYSHPQALAQCRDFLERHGLEAVAAYDTAGSAQFVSEKGPLRTGAIAGRRAAELYGLDILAEGIESDPGNYTRFYVVARPDAAQPETRPATGQDKTVLVFATSHLPGSLYWCLGAFAYRGIDLLKLESRPIQGRPWEYLFYADLRGHASADPVREALRELEGKTAWVRVLGSFEAAEGTPPVAASR